MTTADEVPIHPRVRTMRTAAPVEAPSPVAAWEDDDEVPEEESGAPVVEASRSPIHGGWTAGQQVMDSTSSYAQAFQPNEKLQIIKFLDDQPYANFRRHWIERMTQQGVKKRPFTCLETVGGDCPLCNIADRPQAVSAFNIAVLGDDGQLLLKTWDVGAKLFNVLKAYATDPLVGPLSKDFFAVNTTGSKQTKQTNVTTIKATRLTEDYGFRVPSVDELQRLGRYDQSVIQVPKRSDLEEIAQEISEY